MFRYELTIIVISVSAIGVKITRWIYFIVKEVDTCQSAKRGERPFPDERCYAFIIFCLFTLRYELEKKSFGYSCFLYQILHS